MANEITLKALQDASVDAKSLEEVVNGNESKQVTTRLGESYPSVKKAISQMFENGGLPATPFATKALMEASALIDGDYALVTDDTTTSNNGYYQKQSGSWVFLQWNPSKQLTTYYSDVMQYGPPSDVVLVESDNLYNSSIKSNDVYIKNRGSVITALSGSQIGALPVVSGQYCVIFSSFTQSFVLPSVSNSIDMSVGKEVQVLTGINSTTVSAGIYRLEFTIPSGFSYLLFNTKVGTTVADPFFVGLYNSQISKIGSADIVDKAARAMIKPSVLTNKKWAAIGDSITEHNFRANKNYHDYIADDINSLAVINYGISGTGYFDRYNIADTITQTDFDYLTVFWGTNDWGNQKSTNQKLLGGFLDTGTTTISGCINTALMGLITRFYDKKIAVITPLPRITNWGDNAANNAYGYTLKQLVDLIKRYCNHYSIPCLDLYHESNLPVWIPAANTEYFTAPNNSDPDGLHPNDAGHKIIANKIKAFLESM
ncbi:SGNH/GDSL hydrolase family protein [Psychrobacter sp. F1192]|uniref:SGNH/GDSL hydrolase family protein n=1 Tax=Psychrobacter coccoides TaxID=2818440 RepID=A0ABS3NJT5_9GAMM|nr:SGNH/GDSL hydrolase family protein [Psychrobacter coccoides]MBO1529661.1 SGNH/GDSL hydrolase family protein [Psychrobacter coccoides]